ncbi:MAG: hypothetical protein ACJAVS_000644 [Paracoccaceae bacterium]|jgi:hypothetical protein
MPQAGTGRSTASSAIDATGDTIRIPMADGSLTVR